MVLQRKNTNIHGKANPVCHFDIMVKSFFQETRPQWENNSYYTTGTKKTMNASVMMVIANIVFEAMVFELPFWPNNGARET